MIPVMNAFFDIRPEVAEALSGGRPVVALESTLIAHGQHPNQPEIAGAPKSAPSPTASPPSIWPRPG
jgi:pseudouridine-5'-phosphate glycosidase